MPRIRYFEAAALIAIVVFGAWIYRPFPPARVLGRGETRTIEWLQRIAVAQASFLEDRGRYGFLEELVEAGELEGAGLVDHGGGAIEIERTGYLFRVFLPTRERSATSSASPEDVDAVLARELFGVSAWPIRFNVTGRRVFYLHHDGEIFHTENLGDPYSGREREPRWDAALRDGSLGLDGNPVGDETHGADAKIWASLFGEEDDEKKRGSEDAERDGDAENDEPRKRESRAPAE